MLGLERVEKRFVFGPVFPRKDEYFGVESMLQAVETDGGASSGRLWARAF
jgi:hypothetical protein